MSSTTLIQKPELKISSLYDIYIIISALVKETELKKYININIKNQYNHNTHINPLETLDELENTEDILTLSILMDLTKSLIFNSVQPLGQIAPLHSYISKENGASIIYKILKNYIDSFCLVFKENQVADYFISSISGYQLLTSVFRTIHPICISKKALNKEIFTQIFTDIN